MHAGRQDDLGHVVEVAQRDEVLQADRLARRDQRA
jgi:hypothetical protein